MKSFRFCSPNGVRSNVPAFFNAFFDGGCSFEINAIMQIDAIPYKCRESKRVGSVDFQRVVNYNAPLHGSGGGAT